MESSNSPRESSRPSPSPLQLRLDPNFGNENPQPSPRSQSLESQTSLEDIESLDIPDITRSVSPVVGFVDVEFPESLITSTPETNKAAGVLQKWTKNFLRINKTLRGIIKPDCLAAMSRLFGASTDGGISLLNSLKGCNGNEAIAMSNSAAIAKDVLLFLTALPRDRLMRKMPVTLHGPRAFLAGALVITHPSVILGPTSNDANLTLEAKFLRNASSMLMVSSKCLANILLNYSTSTPGQLRLFRRQLIMVRFARRYHATAFHAFKTADANRVVDQLLGPYAELVAAELQAKRTHNASMASAARSRMEQIHQSVSKLIGESSANAKLQEVEAAIEQQFSDTFGPLEESSNLPQVPTLEEPSTAPLVPASAAAAAAEEEEVTNRGLNLKEIESSLVNEQLAHELILDAKYQLPELPEPKPFEPPSLTTAVLPMPTPESLAGLSQIEAQAQVQEQISATMQDLFWKKLIKSLTPVKQKGREDFKEATIVQAKYGGANGTFYDAKIMKVNDDGTFDIKYVEDNVEEKSCSITQFRTSDDHIDPRPLISLLNEVMVRIEKATPNRVDLHEKYRMALDMPLLIQMLEKGAMDNNHMMQLVDFFLDTLSNLEAPARAARTLKWKVALHAYVSEATISSEQNSAKSSDDYDPSPMLLVLPSLFTFLHAALDQLQRDTVNVHLTMVATKFQGEEGVTYERQHFDAKLTQGITTLNKTHYWLESCVDAFCSSSLLFPTETSTTNTYSLRKQHLSSRDAPKHSLYRRCFIEFACLDLIAKAQFRWDSTDAAQHIPETLVLDAPRLAQARDSMDRIVLTSTLLVLLRQVLAKKRVALSAASASKLQDSLCDLLKSPQTRLPDLQQSVVETAQEAVTTAPPASASSSLKPVLEQADLEYLKGLVSNAANPTNAIFALFTKRVLQLFRVMISYDKAMNYNGKTFEDVVDEEIGATGLLSFRSEILETGRTLNRFIRHNSNVFAPHYSSLIESIGSSLPPPPAAPTA